MPTINILGFSCCTLPGCDCGSRVVLGVRRTELKRMVGLLEAEGFSLREVPPMKPGEPGSRADSEPMGPGALTALTAYLKEG
jgi:hypothetical protein